jgi:tripartite-type tricarboxylate transporter receptor subunit TctC
MASKRRHPMLPDVPTSAEAGMPGFELDAWFAAYAPAGTPAPVIERLASAIETIVKGESFRERAEQAGAYATYMDPAQLAKFTETELEHWSAVIRKAGITGETQ